MKFDFYVDISDYSFNANWCLTQGLEARTKPYSVYPTLGNKRYKFTVDLPDVFHADETLNEVKAEEMKEIKNE